jgi:hypothetical protein
METLDQLAGLVGLTGAFLILWSGAIGILAFWIY